MSFDYVRRNISNCKIGNFNEMTFFIKCVKSKAKGSILKRIWKLSTHPEKPPDIECVDENLATEMTQARKDYQNNRKGK
jgi:hypothetical protein